MKMPSNWKDLIEEATRHEAKLLVIATRPKQRTHELKVMSK